MGWNPFAPKAPADDTASYAAAEQERVSAQAQEQKAAARRQAVLDTQGCANGEWDKANKRIAEQRKRLLRAYR